MPQPDPYETLGVPRDADQAWIRDAYERAMARAIRDGATRHALDISAAFDTLGKPASRALYDRHGIPAVRERSPGASPPPTPWRIAKHQTREPARKRSRSWRMPVLATFCLGIVTGLIIAAYALRSATQSPAPVVEQQVVCDSTPAGEGYVYSEPAGNVPACRNGAVPRVVGTSAP